MYATIKIQAGKSNRYLTLPRTAVTFNPYGETVYIVEEKGQTKGRQAFVVCKTNFRHSGIGARRPGSHPQRS